MLRLEGLYEFYLEAISCCSSKLLNEHDDIVAYYLYEILDADTTYLSVTCLERLLNAGLISEQVFNLSGVLRDTATWLLGNDNVRDIGLVRTKLKF